LSGLTTASVTAKYHEGKSVSETRAACQSACHHFESLDAFYREPGAPCARAAHSCSPAGVVESLAFPERFLLRYRLRGS